MPKPLTDASLRRRHRTRGAVSLSIAAALGVAIVAGWMGAGGDPQAHVSGRGWGLPLWAASIWIGALALALVTYGVSQLRGAALFSPHSEE